MCILGYVHDIVDTSKISKRCHKTIDLNYVVGVCAKYAVCVGPKLHAEMREDVWSFLESTLHAVPCSDITAKGLTILDRDTTWAYSGFQGGVPRGSTQHASASDCSHKS